MRKILNFYYVCLKGSKKDRAEFAYKNGQEMTLVSFILFLASILFRLMCGFVFFMKDLSFVSFICSFLGGSNIVIVFYSVIKGNLLYNEIAWEEFQTKVKRTKEKDIENKRMLESKRNFCIYQLNILSAIAKEHDVYLEFIENIFNIERKINNARTIAELDLISLEILNNIKYIEQTYKYKHRSGLAYYLKILELDSNVTDMELVKKKRKELALKYHPDNKITGNLQKMKEINDAFDEIKKILG